MCKCICRTPQMSKWRLCVSCIGHQYSIAPKESSVMRWCADWPPFDKRSLTMHAGRKDSPKAQRVGRSTEPDSGTRAAEAAAGDERCGCREGEGAVYASLPSEEHLHHPGKALAGQRRNLQPGQTIQPLGSVYLCVCLLDFVRAQTMSMPLYLHTCKLDGPWKQF